MNPRPQNSPDPIWAATPDKIKEATKRIIEAADPVKIILFGSHARGDAAIDSDVDILVIKRKVEDRFSEIVRLNTILRGLIMAADILVIDEAGFAEWSDTPGSVYHTAKKEGKVLYEAA